MNILEKMRQFISSITQKIITRRLHKNPKFYLPVSVFFLSTLFATGILQTIVSWLLVILIMIFSVISGMSIVLVHGKHRVPPLPKPTAEQQQVTRLLETLTKNYKRHYYRHRIVISRQMDKALQEVIDLVVRDFCLSWFSNVGKDETAFVELLNKEFWKIIENVTERLRNVDLVNFLANDFVTRLCTHFQDLRLSDARTFPGQTCPLLLHPALKDSESEVEYLRTISEALLYCLLPPTDANCPSLKFILRELMANFVLLPTAESICDPDYINQTLVIYLEDREKITETRKQQYAYAETYEDFVKLINTTFDVETLKQIRYI